MAIIARPSGNNVITATAADDQITTGSGNDTINAGEGNNTIDAGDGNNVLTAGSGNDTITSGAGNDVINAGAGHNRIRAGAGNNVVTSGAGNDDILSGAGNDTINAGDGINTINAGGGANTITSGSGDDTITSGSGNDTINAGNGHNTINAGDGVNRITTGTGDDSITSGAGNDTINAGNGNNTVISGAGNDVINTGSGADLIDAGGNNDVVNSGAGNDIIVHRLPENASALDQYDGSSGQDTLRLVLSSAEWARADVQADVAAFLARANPAAFFRFNSTNLTVVNIEKLEVFVEGKQLNPADEPVTATADNLNLTEDTPTASVNLLLNDSVPDRALSVRLEPSTLGAVSLVNSLGGAVQTATLNFVPSPSLQSLAQGETRSETLKYRVQDVDGDVSTASVVITVTGVNDAASISGNASGAVSEDGTLQASGQLSVSDVDTGENVLQPVAAGTLGANGYGTFEVKADGRWTYTLNNSLPAVQALNTGDTLTDTLTVRSRDGTASQTLQVSIAGQSDNRAPLAANDAGLGGGVLLPATGDVQVNTTTAAFQAFANVVALSGGGFAVSWSSENQDGDDFGVFVRLFDASGAPVSGEVQVNTFTAKDQWLSSMAALPDGGFVVTWSSVLQDGDLYGIFGQRFDALGAQVGGEFQVNTTTALDQRESSVVALEGGGFVVTWSGDGQDGDQFGIFAQRYDATGARDGVEFRVNTSSAGAQRYPSLAALPDGGFVVTWTGAGQGGDDFGVYGQRFDATGAAVGAEFAVNSFTAGRQGFTSVAALGDGGFVVAWSSDGQDGSSLGVYAQRFDAAGGRVGAEFAVNTFTALGQAAPAVAGLDDGGFLITWSSLLQDGSENGIYGQRFGASGERIGGEFRLNVETQGNQDNDTASAGEPLAVLADGSVVAVWSGLFNIENVFARRFELAPGVSEDEISLLKVADLLANDSDPDSDALAITQVSATSALGAALTLVDTDADLVFDRIRYDPTGAAALQALDAGQTLVDSFGYSVSDGRGGLASATVEVTVVGLPEPTGVTA